jgi:hypothetical protein
MKLKVIKYCRGRICHTYYIDTPEVIDSARFIFWKKELTMKSQTSRWQQKSSKQTFIKNKHIYTRISFNMIVFITKKTQSFRGRDRCLHFFLKLKHNYIDVPKVSGHCDFLLYISCKTTFFKNIIPKSTLFRYWLFFYQQKRERT